MTLPYYCGTTMLLVPCCDATMILMPLPAQPSIAETLRKLLCEFQVNPFNSSNVMVTFIPAPQSLTVAKVKVLFLYSAAGPDSFSSTLQP